MVIEQHGLRQRLERVRQEIAAAAQKAGRDPAEITLVGVSKEVLPAAALAAYQAGLMDLGENRVDGLLGKQNFFQKSGARPNWHMIGTLQRRKVRQIIGHTHLIHSVDTLALLEEISKRSSAAGLDTSILLQVNSSQEASKHGFTDSEVVKAALLAQDLPGIRLCGLMTMAQLTDDPETTRPVFQKTQALFQEIKAQLPDPAGFTVLSMGMSQDYQQAIECGATHVRIGRAIFGSR